MLMASVSLKLVVGRDEGTVCEEYEKMDELNPI